MKNTNENENENKKKHLSPMHYPQLLLFHLLIVILMLWLIFGVFIGITHAPNDDMAPRIESGDMLIYYRRDKNVSANDVIVLEKNNTEYVARVIAVGGDTVDITDDEKLVINGNTVIEKNIYYETVKYREFIPYPYTVESGKCFVLVDKRQSGEDSRYFGTVSKDEICGTVLTVVRSHNI